MQLKVIRKKRCITLQIAPKEPVERLSLAQPDLISSHLLAVCTSLGTERGFLLSFSCLLFKTKTFRYSSVNDTFEERPVEVGKIPRRHQPQCRSSVHPSSGPLTVLPNASQPPLEHSANFTAASSVPCLLNCFPRAIEDMAGSTQTLSTLEPWKCSCVSRP